MPRGFCSKGVADVAWQVGNLNDSLIEMRPRENELCLRTKDIIDTINRHGDSVATILIGSVNYYTGQAFEIEKITKTETKMVYWNGSA